MVRRYCNGAKSKNFNDFQNLNPDSLYFRDGRRKIDMVLVYEEEELGVMTEAEAKRRDNRKVFQVCVFNFLCLHNNINNKNTTGKLGEGRFRVGIGTQRSVFRR